MLKIQAVLLLLVAGLAWGADFPLSELQVGQQGYGVTAGPGNVLERFPVEILGLQRDVGTGFPVILVKASGPFIERSGGVAAGMSGSPVYLPLEGEDALLGAIGYTFPNSDHSLALVTPIETMQKAVHAGDEGTTAQGTFTPFGEAAFEGLGPPTPVSTPLLLSGLSERASAALSPLFRGSVTPFPMQIAGGNTDGARDEAYVLEPGSAVSVLLVRGDVTIAAVGTLTRTEEGDGSEGATFLAFGHPLLNQGAVSFALAPAYVSYIVSSEVVPFKLADSGAAVLGTVTQDRPYAIGGTLGREPDFLPVSLTLTTDRESVSKRFEVTDDPALVATLLGAASLQVFDEARERIGGGSAELAWEIVLKGGETVRVLEQVTSPNDVAGAAAALAAEPLAVLADNIFADPEIERVALNVTLTEAQRYAEVVQVVAEVDTLEPDDPLTLFVRLQPYRGEPEVKTLRVPLPEEATGTIEVTVRGGLEARSYETNGDGDGGEDDPILSFSELLVALREHVQSSELVVETTVEGEVRRLERLPLPFVVRGTQTVSVTVEAAGDPEDESTEAAEDVLEPAPSPEPPSPPLEEDPPIRDEPR